MSQRLMVAVLLVLLLSSSTLLCVVVSGGSVPVSHNSTGPHSCMYRWLQVLPTTPKVADINRVEQIFRFYVPPVDELNVDSANLLAISAAIGDEARAQILVECLTGRLEVCRQSRPCNAGRCLFVTSPSTHRGSYQCQCDSGYTGQFCDTALPSCSGNPCQNGGTCEATATSYQCKCPPLYSGRHCERKWLDEMEFERVSENMLSIMKDMQQLKEATGDPQGFNHVEQFLKRLEQRVAANLNTTLSGIQSRITFLESMHPRPEILTKSVTQPGPTNDCQVTEWTEWSACSVTCLSGTQTRTRDITQQPIGVGRPCPSLKKITLCRPRDDCGCGNYPLGSTHASIPQTTQDVAADVIVVMSESSSMGFSHAWSPGTIRHLEDTLVRGGIGDSPSLRNHYVLVGFGRFPIGDDVSPVRPRAFRNRAGERVFTIESFNEVTSQLRAGGNIEDGYLAIKHALENITDASGHNLLRLGRPDITTNIIFLSDKERDVFDPYGSDIDRSRIMEVVRRSGATLNVIINQELFSGNRRAFGLDWDNIAYIVENGGEYSTSTNSRIGSGYLTTRADYSTVALELGGCVWDIKILRQGGAVGASFVNAFYSRVNRQIHQCQTCNCVDTGRTAQWICKRATNQVQCKAEALAGRG